MASAADEKRAAAYRKVFGVRSTPVPGLTRAQTPQPARLPRTSGLIPGLSRLQAPAPGRVPASEKARLARMDAYRSPEDPAWRADMEKRERKWKNQLDSVENPRVIPPKKNLIPGLNVLQTPRNGRIPESEKIRLAEMDAYVDPDNKPIPKRRLPSVRQSELVPGLRRDQTPGRRDPKEVARLAEMDAYRDPDNKPIPSRNGPARATNTTGSSYPASSSGRLAAAPQGPEREGVSSQSPMVGPALRVAQGRAGRRAPSSSTAEPAEWQTRRSELWNKHMRRELTDEEFAGLTPEQQSQVRLNNKLTQAYDLDRETSSTEVGNVNGILSQLGLDAQKKGSVGLPLTTSTASLGLGGTVTPAGKDRQKQVSSIAESLAKFLGTTAEADGQSALQAGLARKDEFNFADPVAKETFELAFDYFMDPSLGPQSLGSWENAKGDLKAQGYNPDEFREYARTRLQMLPSLPGQLDLPTLDAWFGGS